VIPGVCLSIGLFAGAHRMLQADLAEILRDGSSPNLEVIRFGW